MLVYQLTENQDFRRVKTCEMIWIVYLCTIEGLPMNKYIFAQIVEFLDYNRFRRLGMRPMSPIWIWVVCVLYSSVNQNNRRMAWDGKDTITGGNNCQSIGIAAWRYRNTANWRNFLTKTHVAGFECCKRCQFIREARDLLCIGAPGTGKSHLTQAIGYEAVKRGFAVIYSSIFDLIREFQYPELGKEKAILTKYLKCDLLIIDDMGLKSLPDRAGEILFELIMRRYELRSTIMTSNRPIEDWGKLIGDVATAGAILDRLLQNAMVIPFKGRSYRLRKAAGELWTISKKLPERKILRNLTW